MFIGIEYLIIWVVITIVNVVLGICLLHDSRIMFNKIEEWKTWGKYAKNEIIKFGECAKENEKLKKELELRNQSIDNIDKILRKSNSKIERIKEIIEE